MQNLANRRIRQILGSFFSVLSCSNST